MKLHLIHSAPFFSRALKFIGFSVLMLFLSTYSFGQNTKGDKPVKNQRQVRETRGKSVKKKEKGRTRDIANRRLRTKDQSSANRANRYPQTSPYSNRSRNKERAAKPRGRTFSQSPRESKTQAWKGDVSGYPIKRIKPGRNDAARTNVYPQKGPYVRYARKQPSKRPPTYSRTIKGKRFVEHQPRYKEKAWKGGLDNRPIKNQSATGSVRNTFSQKGRYVSSYKRHPTKKQTPFSNGREIGQAARNSRRPLTGGSEGNIIPASVSRLFIKRGKRNVYWGKYSKKEKPFLKDITGGPLRTKNFRTMPAGLVGRDTLNFFGRKPSGDRANKVQTGGYVSGSQGGRWKKGDIAGWRLRRSARGRKEVAGRFVFPRKLSISNKMGRSGKVPGSGFQTGTKRGEQAQLSSVPSKVYNRNINGKVRKGVKPFGGGPGSFAAGFSGNIRRRGGFSQQGTNYSGNIRRNRLRGFSTDGVNYSGRIKRSSQRGISTEGANYSGNIKRNRLRGFSTEGANYSGNIKQNRLRGFSTEGVNYSGRIKRNSQRRFSTDGLGYAGNLRKRGFSTDGVNYSGRIKRSSRQGFSTEGLGYAGNLRRRGFSTDGVNYSGRIKRSSQRGFSTEGLGYAGNLRKRGFSTDGVNYSGRIKRSSQRGYSNEGLGYAGNLRKRGFSEQGVGSSGNIKRSSVRGISTDGLGSSGRIKTSNIIGFTPQGVNFAGHLKRGRIEKGGGSVSGKLNSNKPLIGTPPKTTQGGNYSGNIKFKKPEKGGGSVSNQPRNNNDKPVLSTPLGSDEINYSGRIALSRFKKNYIQNPNASKESLKKQRPDKTSYMVTGLQIKVRQGDYQKKPNAAKNSLPGIAPSKATVKASEYSKSMKQYWDYKHNPSSSKESLKVRAPGKAFARISDYQGNVKMHKYSGSRLHPDAQFAHGYEDNVKGERTLLMNVKLMWGKLFRKNETQPENLKEKLQKPRYDKREKGMWND
ncbi:MAG: hypothetical protein HOP08_11800 [Cyclobacteriaceae bacterium]|nr:hypothetical protein [Cyclobacteriaceae bacterium]